MIHIVEFHETLLDILKEFEFEENKKKAQRDLAKLLKRAKKAKLKHINVSVKIFDQIEERCKRTGSWIG